MSRLATVKHHIDVANPGSSHVYAARAEVGLGTTKPGRHTLGLLAACVWMLTNALPADAQEINEKTAAPQNEALPKPDPLPAEIPASKVSKESLPKEAGTPHRTGDMERSLNEGVVTSYRNSLGAALVKKRSSTTQVDAIVAEDVADFPDLNLADSLQRVPGISITRVNGEGGRVTVRGLSGHYTRTRLNGMDAQAIDVDNTTREFDYNFFASELFNSILIHKTASAELGEGSLGSVIDLGTARPLNFKKGLSIVGGVQGSYNDLSNTAGPRMTGVLNYHDPGSIWGVTASVAYSKTRNDSVTSDSGGWSQSRFALVNGASCTGVTSSDECNLVTNAFHPRSPRYITSQVVSERLGVTSGLQLKLFSKTEVRLDGLFATYNRRSEDRAIEALLRGNEAAMNVTSYQNKQNPERFGLSNNDLTSLSLNNTWVRSESSLVEAKSKFYQLTLAVDHEFTRRVYAKALAGRAVNSARKPSSLTSAYDIRGYNGYSYDYSRDPNLPVLKYGGVDINVPANFTLTELRDQSTNTRNTHDTAEFKLYWEVLSALRLSTGGTFKRMIHDTWQRYRDGLVCESGLLDCDLDNDGTNELLGPKGEPGLSRTTHYPGEVGAGSATSWTSAIPGAWADRLNYYSVPFKDDLARTRTIQETKLGGFMQAEGEIGFGSGMRLNYNVGLQYVQTRQTSSGYILAEVKNMLVEFKRPMYQNWLPSGNLAFWPTEKLVVRTSVAQVMARPILAALSPGGSVDSISYRSSFQNPNLDPTRALALDASVEWYFLKESVFSLAFFRKDIESFPTSVVRRGTFTSTELPKTILSPTSPAGIYPEGTCMIDEGCWDITPIVNGPGTTINGLEISFQAPFSSFYAHLPPVVRSLGVIGNVTLIDSEFTYKWDANIKVIDRFPGLSPKAFNGTLYFDNAKFAARVSFAHRSSYIDANAATNLTRNLFQFANSSTRIDASAKYKISNRLELNVEVMNLTNTPERSGVDINANRPLNFRRTGRGFLLGARYSL